jgi:AcrR family transcriptional regulator
MAKQGSAGPEARIMEAARTLFYRNGIHETGVNELARAAEVSKRTIYQLFESKDDIVVAYLRYIGEHGRLGVRALDRTDLTPRERLVALFDRPYRPALFRGCPLHNAAVELAGSDHPGRAVIAAHKRATLAKLVETAAEAGAEDPATLARQLLTVYEGATALATSLADLESFDFARSAATALIDAALGEDLDMIGAEVVPSSAPH